MKKVSLFVSAFFLAALLSTGAFAQSLSKNVTIPTNVQVAGKSLPMGTYKLKVESNGNATFLKNGHEVATVPARIEQTPNRLYNTALQIDHSSSTPQLQRVEFAGTTSAVVFGTETNTNASGR